MNFIFIFPQITVFRMGDREESKDIDLAILTALLKGLCVLTLTSFYVREV